MDAAATQDERRYADPDRFDLVCHTFSDVVATPDSSESTIRFYGRRIAIKGLQSLNSRNRGVT